jgi:anti-sigma B factor antagonist
MDLEVVEQSLSSHQALLVVNGRLNAVTAPELKARIKRLVNDGFVQLVIDLVNVSFIDSSGIAALVAGLKAARMDNGALKLVGMNEQVRTVFRLTLLDRVFEFYPDVETARESFPVV